MSMSELRGLLIKRMSQPRTFSLHSGMTLFIGGIGRLDILEVRLFMTSLCSCFLRLRSILSNAFISYNINIVKKGGGFVINIKQVGTTC